jgi:4'-phosphopantetheinyl transferase
LRKGTIVFGVDEVEVYLIDISARRSGLPSYRGMLSAGEKARAAGFHFEEDRTRYVCMHGVLRELLASYLGMGPGRIVFRENRYGKPRVAGGPEFSISYSGGMGLIGVSRVPLGVDIEKVDPEKVTPEMIEEVFSPSERRAYFEDESADAVDSFFRGWVRKESIIKAIGKGVSLPLQSVESSLDVASFTAVCVGARWLTRDMEECGPDYRAAVTVASAGSPPAIKSLR